MNKEIIFERNNDWGVVTLNRPEALNALTWDMVKALRATLVDWARDGAVKAVLIKGAGDKAFCAGGDIRWLQAQARTDPAYACGFFHEEYRLNAAIHHFKKPYVAVIDGVVMGGGVGISVHGTYRIAGDRTLFAMPETAIGLFPDVGGGYFLPRLQGGLGLYYALTGARAKAADCVAAGIATHYAPTGRKAALEAALTGLSFGVNPCADIEVVLEDFSGGLGGAPIEELRLQIASLFAGHERLEDLIAGLGRNDGAFAIETAKTLARMSPTSMKLTFEQLKRGAGLSFDEAMRMEFRMVRRVMEGHDFFEGVRSVLVDKDKNAQWRPAVLGEVSDADIARYFAPLASGELGLP